MKDNSYRKVHMFKIFSLLVWFTDKFFIPQYGVVGYGRGKVSYLIRIGFLSIKTNSK